VQFTPPGSPCSIIFGRGITSAVPGSAQGLYLILSDIEAARAELVDRGVEVSEVFHDVGGVFHHAGREGRLNGPDPQRRSYASFASFSDPDGNGWLLQEVTVRLPGRVDADSKDIHLVRRACERDFVVRRSHTASTRSGSASEMRAGPTGTQTVTYPHAGGLEALGGAIPSLPLRAKRS
jgi:hypothetical protein